MTDAERIAATLKLFADGLREASEKGEPMQPPNMLTLSAHLRDIAFHLAPPVDFAALERAAGGVVVRFPARGWHSDAAHGDAGVA